MWPRQAYRWAETLFRAFRTRPAIPARKSGSAAGAGTLGASRVLKEKFTSSTYASLETPAERVKTKATRAVLTPDASVPVVWPRKSQTNGELEGSLMDVVPPTWF